VTRADHRSRRADFPHLARHLMTSLRDPLLFRGHGLGSRHTCHVSLQRFMRRRPLPSSGSLSVWFPRLIGSMSRSNSLPSVSPRFTWRYHCCDRCSSPAAPAEPEWDIRGDIAQYDKYALCPLQPLSPGSLANRGRSDWARAVGKPSGERQPPVKNDLISMVTTHCR
jgi:hypothetical protein